METLEAFLGSYGHWLFFALGFAEFLGVPIVSVPVLVAAGALAGMGGLSLWRVVLSVAAGGLLADLVWYWAGRKGGARLVDVGCGLSSNPTACVTKVTSRLSSLGPAYIVLAKMIPGAGNLIALAAGLSGLKLLVFVITDSASLVLWATVYTGVGWVFSGRVEEIIEWVLIYRRSAVVIAVALVISAAVWRWIKVRLHEDMHHRMSPRADGAGGPTSG